MVAEEYHLDVLGINLQGGRKTSKNKIALVSPKQRGGDRNSNFGRVPGVRDQGSGTSQVSYRPGPTKIDPDPASLWLKSSQGGQKCCGADFGSRKKISRHPLGRSTSFFEIYLVRAARIPKNRNKNCVSSPGNSLRAPLWQTPISPTKGWAPQNEPLFILGGR